MRGNVYVIQPEGHNVYKIGCSVNPKSRMARIQKRVNVPLSIVLIIPSDNQERLEARLHILFRAKSICHEWFILSSEDIEFIKALANGH